MRTYTQPRNRSLCEADAMKLTSIRIQTALSLYSLVNVVRTYPDIDAVGDHIRRLVMHIRNAHAHFPQLIPTLRAEIDNLLDQRIAVSKSNITIRHSALQASILEVPDRPS
jgi:hypothetical protein